MTDPKRRLPIRAAAPMPFMLRLMQAGKHLGLVRLLTDLPYAAMLRAAP